MEESQREKMALFRYGVIRDLISRPLGPGEKEHLLLEIASREWSIPGSSRRQIGRSTARDWLTLYELHGFEGLKPAQRCDVGTSRTLSAPIQELLLELRAARPRASVDSLIRAVQLSQKPGETVRLPRSTIYRFLAAQGQPAPGERTGTPDARAFTYEHSGDLWVADVMHGPRLLVPGRRGIKTYLHALIDDASRIVPFAAFYGSENAACFTDCLKQAMLRRGVPRRLYCDNGAPYRTQHLQVVCATLNVALIHSRPHQPRGRGKIERFFRHVRSAFLPHISAEMLGDLGALNRMLWAWIEGEYHQTAHRGIAGKTPVDRFLEDQEHIRPAPEDLERLLRMKYTRRVGRDRTVRLQGRLYETPDGWAGERVDVFFDPYDPVASVSFRATGDREAQEIPLRRLDPTTNARLPRQRPVSEPEPAPSTGISYLELIARRFYGQEE